MKQKMPFPLVLVFAEDWATYGKDKNWRFNCTITGWVAGMLIKETVDTIVIPKKMIKIRINYQK